MEPIQLQKMLFKFARESGAPKPQQYDFVPYNWGPCSFGIYDDLAELREEGLVEFEPSGLGWNAYRLTDRGAEVLNELRSRAKPELLRRMDDIREWVTTRSFSKLLQDVYADYPELSERSLFKK